MGCNKYYLEGIDYPVTFSEMNDDIGCLCTFPHNNNDALDPETVRSLAYLGAAVVMVSREQLDHGYIPNCLPNWIKKEIDRIVLK
jgi:hypothetical protein